MGGTIETWDTRLPENALVYGVEVQARTKAYVLAGVQAEGGVVNDELAQAAVVVVARGPFEVAAYERTVDGRELRFEPASRPEGPMSDRETGSVWSADGEAVAGPLRGSRLRRLDGYLVEWHVWSAYNPGTDLFEVAPPSSAHGPRAVLPTLTLQPLGAARAERLRLPGAVNLVAVWTAWCGPCREEMPQLERLVREHAARGLRAAGLAVLIPEEFEVDAVRRFVAEAGITFPIYLVDEVGYDRLDAVSKRTGGPGLVLPTVFIADKQARILEVLRGRDVASLPAALERWLPASPPG
jgi:thiol-disulfide isomerase/thioredoxin